MHCPEEKKAWFNLSNHSSGKSRSFFMKNEMCVWPAETNFKNLKNRTFASPPHCWDLAISFKMAKWACSSQEKQKCWWLQNRVRELNLEMGDRPAS